MKITPVTAPGGGGHGVEPILHCSVETLNGRRGRSSGPRHGSVLRRIGVAYVICGLPWGPTWRRMIGAWRRPRNLYRPVGAEAGGGNAAPGPAPGASVGRPVGVEGGGPRCFGFLFGV